MQFAMNELVTAFEKTSQIKCQIVTASSGKLTAQIKAGAPYDLFVSADMKYPLELFESGFSSKTPKVYAKGHLVFWTLQDQPYPQIELLQSESIKHIAIANPMTAPYGEAAMKVLEYYDLKKTLEAKLVYGESISQVNQFILSKSAEIGITAKSTVMTPEMKNKGYWTEIDSSAYSAVEQGVVILNHSNSKDAQRFYDFLFSSEAKKILKEFGYSVNE